MKIFETETKKLERNHKLGGDYPTKIRRKLYTKYGVDGLGGNFTLERTLTEKEIKEVCSLVMPYDGICYNGYTQWETKYNDSSVIKRLVIGWINPEKI